MKKQNNSIVKCEKCKEEVNLLNAYVYLGPGWIRWVCPKCNYERNYKSVNEINLEE